MNGKIISSFLVVINQIQVWHWQTDSYAQHNALGEFYSKFVDLADKFIECYQGKNNEVFRLDATSINIKNFQGTEYVVKAWIPAVTKLLSTNLESYIKDDTVLLNIRDEMLAELNKLSYLFSLR